MRRSPVYRYRGSAAQNHRARRQRHNLPYFCITNQVGLTRKEAEAVARAFDAGDIDQVYREVLLAGILELTAAKLRSGENWDDGTIADVFRKITTANYTAPAHRKIRVSVHIYRTPLPSSARIRFSWQAWTAIAQDGSAFKVEVTMLLPSMQAPFVGT